MRLASWCFAHRIVAIRALSVVLSVAMLVFFARTAWAWRIASHFAPGRRVLGVQFAAPLAGLQRRPPLVANSRMHLSGQRCVGHRQLVLAAKWVNMLRPYRWQLDRLEELLLFFRHPLDMH